MNIQSKKIRKSSFFQKSLFSHLQKWDFYKSFILACVWSAKKYFKTHHGQIRWTPETPLLSNTPLILGSSEIVCWEWDWYPWRGGASPALCCCRTGQFAAMRAAKCGKFSAYFRPVTHYGMVIKR